MKAKLAGQRMGGMVDTGIARGAETRHLSLSGHNYKQVGNCVQTRWDEDKWRKLLGYSCCSQSDPLRRIKKNKVESWGGTFQHQGEFLLGWQLGGRPG